MSLCKEEACTSTCSILFSICNTLDELLLRETRRKTWSRHIVGQNAEFILYDTRPKFDCLLMYRYKLGQLAGHRLSYLFYKLLETVLWQLARLRPKWWKELLDTGCCQLTMQMLQHLKKPTSEFCADFHDFMWDCSFLTEALLLLSDLSTGDSTMSKIS